MKKSAEEVVLALETVGFKLPFPKVSPGKFIKAALKAILTQRKLWRMPEGEKLKNSRLYALEHFPAAFRSTNSSAASLDLFVKSGIQSELHEKIFHDALEEILQILDVAVKVFYLLTPGKTYIQNQEV
jgi:hypothetical protein